MKTHDPFFYAPLPTEIPDYVWARRYDRPSYVPGKPAKKEEDTARRIPHSSAEAALQAAKYACRAHPGRWFGRSLTSASTSEFLVYESGTLIERHVVTG